MRELVVLGTASQAPTRHRNHNGYFLRWDGEGILFDPGEGTQRQMILAGVPASSCTRICITHFHGDHCLGLPGVVQRLSLDAVSHPVALCYPASGQMYVEHLLQASVYEERAELRRQPVSEEGLVDPGPPFALVARRLSHRPETFGWRIEEPAGHTFVPERLQAFAIRGEEVGELQRAGVLTRPGSAPVRLEEVSRERPGQVVAFVMDTALCDAAWELAADADLLICEATYAASEAELAAAYGHLTAGQAGRIAAESGVRALVITHFSQRYPDATRLLDEARAVFPDAVAARDLHRVSVPPRARHV